MVTCDGQGGFLVSVCNSGCDMSFGHIHEKNHRAPLQARYSNVCVGRPLGAAPFPKEWSADDPVVVSFQNELECRAYKVQMECIDRLRDGGLGSSDADQSFNQALNQRRDRQCNASGW